MLLIAFLALTWVGAAHAAPPEVVNVEVQNSYPHDSGAFTQGLLLYEGSLYESTGLYGSSTLRQVNPVTGAVIRSVSLDASLFAEGLARVGSNLIQLTWKEGTAIVWDLATFTEVQRFTYTGEGWGLCFDGTRLVMSDGSSSLVFRDPSTFATMGALPVTLDGAPLDRLNELECVGAFVYANVWWTQSIVQIDAQSGEVVRVANAVNLLTPAERQGTDVLNGVAYNPANGHFFITGKLWPKLFDVTFGPMTSTQDGAFAADGGQPGDATSPGDVTSKPPSTGLRGNSGCAATSAAASVLVWPLVWRRRRR